MMIYNRKRLVNFINLENGTSQENLVLWFCLLGPYFYNNSQTKLTLLPFLGGNLWEICQVCQKKKRPIYHKERPINRSILHIKNGSLTAWVCQLSKNPLYKRIPIKQRRLYIIFEVWKIVYLKFSHFWAMLWIACIKLELWFACTLNVQSPTG